MASENSIWGGRSRGSWVTKAQIGSSAPSGAETETPDQVVKQMRLKPTDVVADIGAGTGYFSFRLSNAVSQGKVYAVDIQPEMLAIIEQRKRRLGVDNVVAVLGTEMDTKLPHRRSMLRCWSMPIMSSPFRAR